jgi:hypothetical protein
MCRGIDRKAIEMDKGRGHGFFGYRYHAIAVKFSHDLKS